MRRAFTSSVFGLGSAAALLAGCTSMDAPRPFVYRPVAPMAAPATQAPPDPNVSPTDEVAFYDLMTSHGLETSIDLVTGRRTCTDDANRVEVMPSTRAITINGVAFPLKSSIRWKDGVLFLPGECRALFAEHLRLAPMPVVRDDERLFDGRAVDLSGWRPSAAASAQPASARPQAAAPGTLPAAWRSQARRSWKYIVIHHSATDAGGAESFGREHQKKWQNGLGYHFVIGNGTHTKPGEVEVGSRWVRQAEGVDGGHAGNKHYNEFGIGVCLVGDFNRAAPTRAQLDSLRRLTQALMKRYGIGKDGIRPHCDVRRGHTDCPGKHFPFREFVASLD